jgi:hypothetical protein
MPRSWRNLGEPAFSASRPSVPAGQADVIRECFRDAGEGAKLQWALATGTRMNPVQGSDNDEITFTLGTGNHSSICGGVTPMKVVDSVRPPEAPPPDSDSTGDRPSGSG